MNSRKIANEILTQVIQNHCSLNEVFSDLLPADLDSKDVGFIKECCYGVLRWYHQLSCIKSILLNAPLREKDADIDHLILLGLFQLLYTNVPDHAAVSETVSVSKVLKKEWAAGLINKCLRRFIREKEKILSSLNENPEGYFSHPKWFIDKIKEAWPDYWKDILEANNKKPPLWLRINIQKTTSEDYLNLLKENNINAFCSDYLSTGILFPTPLPVNHIPKFSEGYVSVQDIAGQFAANLLDLKKDQRVLDACAAPGSKTSHILELQPQLSKLVIVDRDAKRLPMVKENISRLELDHKNIQLVLADTTHTTQWWDGVAFDRILLDPPCSSTGVIRRHPDIKLLKQEKDIDQLSQVQMQLLTTLWKLLKKNGKLLYSTCSVLPEENEQVISNFLAHTEDAKVEKINLPIGIPGKFGVQLFPKEEGPDGFYYALLMKK